MKLNKKLVLTGAVVAVSTVLLWNGKISEESYLYILGATVFSHLSGVQLP